MSALPEELSGGEQQRVAPRARPGERPVLLVADEPTGNLDHRLAGEVMKLFVEISLRGTTVLVATHDQELIRATDAAASRWTAVVSSRARGGRAAAAGPPTAAEPR